MTAAPGPYGSFVVHGGATVDRTAATAARPVAGASNPGIVRTAVGGVGFNVAANLARLGHGVRLVSRVGDDADGRAILAAAAAAGIEASGVAVAASETTASYVATFDDRGELIIGVADMRILDRVGVADDPAGDAPGGLAPLWVADANLAPATLAALAERAGHPGVGLAALAVSPAKAARLAPVLGRVALLFANRREAEALLGTEEGTPPEELAPALAERGPACVVVTDGGRPAAVASGGAVRRFRPPPAAIRSVNGAGDALAAGTLHGLALGKQPFVAVCYGLAAAALTLEAEGTVAEDLSAGRLAERLRAAPVEEVR